MSFYASYPVTGGPPSANQALSNLTSPTAVNQSLVLNTSKSLLLSDSGGATSGFTAPTTYTTPTVWKLPVADGSSGQLLSTDGATNLSWTSVSSGANTSLSNLTSPTALNQTLIFAIPATIKTADNNSGGSNTLIVSTGDTAGSTSGTTTIKSGDSSSGVSGVTTITTGDAIAGSADTIITTGTVNSPQNAGHVILRPGSNFFPLQSTIRFQDGSQGTANFVWASTDANGSGHWTNNIVIQSGATGARPGSPVIGQQYFDTSLAAGAGKPIWFNGTVWVDATGATV